ncbi:MAG: ABC transporter ATP-binding protein [Deltaproteobacteria bacterium]|nr:ABC transporter ATP-binding protein [Nannocystaceae bacterium]
MMADLAVDARGISKVFGSGALAFTALKAVDFQVRRGEFVMLAGPSGSGKTTLLSILGCVLTSSAGELSLLGERVSGLPERKLPAVRMAKIGFIFQGHNLLPALDSRDNVALVLKMKGWTGRDANAEAKRLLERVSLGDKLNARPAELSGGQRQRVAIARALAGGPPLVLADEPTAALDAASGLQATELLREVCRERGDSVVVVTHDNRILHLADRIVHIEDGRIASEQRGALS